MVLLKNILRQQLEPRRYPSISSPAAPVVESSGPSPATRNPHSVAGYESKVQDECAI
jgi:hypothetical protein